MKTRKTPKSLMRCGGIQERENNPDIGVAISLTSFPRLAAPMMMMTTTTTTMMMI
jgi:hypothetical protein